MRIFSSLCHAGAGRLFAVAQGGIKNDDLVAHDGFFLSGFAVFTCQKANKKARCRCKRAGNVEWFLRALSLPPVERVA
jgi:hypothetical protein